MKKSFLFVLFATVFATSVSAEVNEADFKKEKVSQAYQLMSKKYTVFAQQFNVCQQKPNLAECGEPYEKLRSEYIQAKSTYDVIEMSTGKAHADLLAPEMMYSELAKDLTELEFISVKDPKKVEYKNLLTAVNQWQKWSDIKVTQDITMFDALAIHIDAEMKRNHD